jgi:hypothetical protein
MVRNAGYNNPASLYASRTLGGEKERHLSVKNSLLLRRVGHWGGMLLAPQLNAARIVKQPSLAVIISFRP